MHHITSSDKKKAYAMANAVQISQTSLTQGINMEGQGYQQQPYQQFDEEGDDTPPVG